MSLVIDAPLTLAWYFEDESTPATDALLDRVADTGALVPSLWRLEVANAFQTAIRRAPSSSNVDRLIVRVWWMPETIISIRRPVFANS